MYEASGVLQVCHIVHGAKVQNRKPNMILLSQLAWPQYLAEEKRKLLLLLFA